MIEDTPEQIIIEDNPELKLEDRIGEYLVITKRLKDTHSQISTYETRVISIGTGIIKPELLSSKKCYKLEIAMENHESRLQELSETRIETVVILHQPPRILLATKKKRLGKGRYNGFGGGLEDGETIEECAVRETYEEGRITIINPERMGKILFQFQTDEQDHLVHFLKAGNYEGTPKETEEMKPEWFQDNNLPYNNMWAADKYWLPLMLSGKKFEGNFVYGENHQIVKYELKEVPELK